MDDQTDHCSLGRVAEGGERVGKRTAPHYTEFSVTVWLCLVVSGTWAFLIFQKTHMNTPTSSSRAL